MAQRTVRVNELLQREISDILHTEWRSESVLLTITGVDVAPDLRTAVVFYAVIGDEEAKKAARKLLGKQVNRIRAEVARRIVLKYNPEYKFVYDDSSARGVTLIDTLNKIDEADKARDANWAAGKKPSKKADAGSDF